MLEAIQTFVDTITLAQIISYLQSAISVVLGVVAIKQRVEVAVARARQKDAEAAQTDAENDLDLMFEANTEAMMAFGQMLMMIVEGSKLSTENKVVVNELWVRGKTKLGSVSEIRLARKKKIQAVVQKTSGAIDAIGDAAKFAQSVLTQENVAAVKTSVLDLLVKK